MIDEVRAFPGERPFRAGTVTRTRSDRGRGSATVDFVFVQMSFSRRRAAALARPGAASTMPGVRGRAGARERAHGQGTGDRPRRRRHPGRPRRAVGARPRCRRRVRVRAGARPPRTPAPFDGVHLVPVSRYREVAARLETRACVTFRSLRPQDGDRADAIRRSQLGAGLRRARSGRQLSDVATHRTSDLELGHLTSVSRFRDDRRADVDR